jgi:predicted restriction endonuclease
MYNCQFPGCNYITDQRSQISYHHIKPKEHGGSDFPFNRIFLCPTCHTKVFIPEATTGIHSIKGKDSIQIIGKFYSTDGLLISYIDSEGLEQFFKGV